MPGGCLRLSQAGCRLSCVQSVGVCSCTAGASSSASDLGVDNGNVCNNVGTLVGLGVHSAFARMATFSLVFSGCSSIGLKHGQSFLR